MDYLSKNESPLFLDSYDGGFLVGVSGDAICSYTDDPIKCKKDRSDISVVRLSDETTTHLESVKFFELKSLDFIQEHNPKFGYCSVGITANRGNKSIDRNEKSILPEPYGFWANEADFKTYERLGITKSTHLALSFNRKEVFSQEGLKRTAPSLKGLSGSPVWGFKNNSTSEEEPVVVAMLIEYHERDIKAILATRISEILNFIHHNFVQSTAE